MFLLKSTVASGDPVGARNRNAGHCRGLNRQCAKVFRLQIVQVVLSAGAGNRLRLQCHHLEVIFQSPPAQNRVKPRGKIWVLRRDARRITAFMSVVIGIGGRPKFLVFLFPFRVIVAQGDQGRRADGNRIRAQRHGLGNVRARPDAA